MHFLALWYGEEKKKPHPLKQILKKIHLPVFFFPPLVARPEIPRLDLDWRLQWEPYAWLAFCFLFLRFAIIWKGWRSPLWEYVQDWPRMRDRERKIGGWSRADDWEKSEEGELWWFAFASSFITMCSFAMFFRTYEKGSLFVWREGPEGNWEDRVFVTKAVACLRNPRALNPPGLGTACA